MKTEESATQVTVAEYPAVGYLATLDALYYGLTARFLGDIVGSGKEIHLKAHGWGLDLGGSVAVLGGFFHVDPSQYLGACYFSLTDVDVVEGAVRLVIYAADKTTKIGGFEGPAEGADFAELHKKSGTLSVYPTEYDNKVNFIGDSSISSITFEPGDYVITTGEPFDGINVDNIDGKNHQIYIDFKSGRELSEECADFFTDSVTVASGKDIDDYLIHTEGGQNRPRKLSFAFKGTLTINDTDSFEICLGQGDHSGSKNWHLAAQSMVADGNGKKGSLGKYFLEQHESHSFKVKVG